MEMSKAHEKLEKTAVKKAFPAKFSKFMQQECAEKKADKKAPKKSPKK